MTATPPPADPNIPPQQPQYSAAPPAQPAGPLTVEQDISYAGWAHLTSWIGWVAFVGPLIIWLMYKARGPRVANEGKEALNFGITVSAAIIVVNILFGILTAATAPRFDFFTGNVGGWGGFWIFSLLGWLIGLVIVVVALIWALKGYNTVKAGGAYRYPFAIRIIK